MNHKDSIKILNSAIAHIQAQSNTLILNPQDAIREGNELKHYAIQTLKEVNASQAAFFAIKNVSFGSSFMEHFGVQAFGHTHAQDQNQKMYTQGVNALITILQQERDLRKQQLDEEAQEIVLEEQRKSNRIQKRAFWCSIIATIISLVALIVAICK